MPHRQSTSLMSLSHHLKRRETKFFVDFLTRGMRKLVLNKGVSKVNNLKNREIKIAFKPNKNMSYKDEKSKQTTMMLMPLLYTCEKTGIHVFFFSFFYCDNTCKLSTIFYQNLRVNYKQYFI